MVTDRLDLAIDIARQHPDLVFVIHHLGLPPGQLRTEDAHAQLKLVADDLIATLAEQPGKDGRNVALTALVKRLTFVQGLIQRATCSLIHPTPPPWGPGPGPILYIELIKRAGCGRAKLPLLRARILGPDLARTTGVRAGSARLTLTGSDTGGEFVTGRS